MFPSLSTSRTSTSLCSVMLYHGHKYVIIGNLAEFTLFGFLFCRLLDEEKNRTLCAIMRLKSVDMQIDACNNARVLQQPYPDEFKPRRAENTVGQHDSRTSARFQ